MKTNSLGTIAASVLAAAFLAISSGSSSAQVLYTTQTDWALFSGSNPGVAGTAGDTDFSTVNGDWSSSPGLTGLAGGLTISVVGGYNPTAASRPSADRLFLSGKTMTVDYTTTGLVGGTYFQLLAFFNTDGLFGGPSASSDVSMGSYRRATFVLPTFATPGTYLQFGVLANTDYTGVGSTYTIDNLTVVPEPATAGLAIAGIALLAWRIRRRTS